MHYKKIRLYFFCLSLYMVNNNIIWKLYNLKLYIKRRIYELDPDFAKKIDNFFIGWYFNWYKNGTQYIPQSTTLFSDFILNSDILYYYGNYIPDKIKKFLSEKVGKISIVKRKIYTFNITKKQKKRLLNIYTGKKKDFIRLSGNLINFYSILGSINNNSAIPPSIRPNNSFELFGSPLNTSKDYCSPLHFEKKYFSSNGSFFDYKFKPDIIYICNPPFNNDIMFKVMTKIINVPKNIKFIITIPVWDSEMQRKIGIQDYGQEYRALNILKKSKRINFCTVLHKYKYKYYNYYLDKYLPLSYTYFITIGNINHSDILNKWKSL